MPRNYDEIAEFKSLDYEIEWMIVRLFVLSSYKKNQ